MLGEVKVRKLSSKHSKSFLNDYMKMEEDKDYPLMIVSAVRYALPRHSYMVSTTQSFVERHWNSLSKFHWCILRDIREYILEEDTHSDKYDTNSWISLYNSLIERKETSLEIGDYQYLLEPLDYIE